MTSIRHYRPAAAAALTAMLAPAGLAAFEGRQPEILCDIPAGCAEAGTCDDQFSPMGMNRIRTGDGALAYLIRSPSGVHVGLPMDAGAGTLRMRVTPAGDAPPVTLVSLHRDLSLLFSVATVGGRTTYGGQCRITATDGGVPFDPFSDQGS